MVIHDLENSMKRGSENPLQKFSGIGETNENLEATGNFLASD